MKIVAIIPIKKKSVRVKNKNFRLINKKPLFEYTLEKLKYCKFDEVYVDSDSENVKTYCKKNKINFIERLPKLATKNANGNNLLLYHSKIIEEHKNIAALSWYWTFLLIVWLTFFLMIYVFNDAFIEWCKSLI